jgi:hypothetical protein
MHTFNVVYIGLQSMWLVVILFYEIGAHMFFVSPRWPTKRSPRPRERERASERAMKKNESLSRAHTRSVIKNVCAYLLYRFRVRRL